LEPPLVARLADLPAASASIFAAVATGELTPGEGHSLSSILASHRQVVEAVELEARLRAVEAKIAVGPDRREGDFRELDDENVATRTGI
jgi:hypothetical protein